ncbi:MAG: zinc-dependent alcohol dehydrogenase family protein, partial [Bacteroidales bacterium]
IPEPKPDRNDVLIKVNACGVCHTEIDEIEGRTPPAKFPVILGHQVVGIIKDMHEHSEDINIGDRVGVAWIFSACGKCKFCLSGKENLCPDFMATGRDVHGGYAEYMLAKADFIYKIPEVFSDTQAAPLLCAGAIGYRSLKLAELKNGLSLGLTGFGASAHLVLKMVKHKYPDTEVFVFARSEKEREFAIQLGAAWAGDTTDTSPVKLDSVIDTTPVWKPVVKALNNLAPGGRLVINAIRKENTDKDYVQKINYSEHLWMEKEIKSVANVERNDVKEFLKIASEIPIKPETQEYTLEQANTALMEIKQRNIKGAKVLVL